MTTQLASGAAAGGVNILTGATTGGVTTVATNYVEGNSLAQDLGKGITFGAIAPILSLENAGTFAAGTGLELGTSTELKLSLGMRTDHVVLTMPLLRQPYLDNGSKYTHSEWSQTHILITSLVAIELGV